MLIIRKSNYSVSWTSGIVGLRGQSSRGRAELLLVSVSFQVLTCKTYAYLLEKQTTLSPKKSLLLSTNPGANEPACSGDGGRLNLWFAVVSRKVLIGSLLGMQQYHFSFTSTGGFRSHQYRYQVLNKANNKFHLSTNTN